MLLRPKLKGGLGFPDPALYYNGGPYDEGGRLVEAQDPKIVGHA